MQLINQILKCNSLTVSCMIVSITKQLCVILQSKMKMVKENTDLHIACLSTSSILLHKWDILLTPQYQQLTAVQVRIPAHQKCLHLQMDTTLLPTLAAGKHQLKVAAMVPVAVQPPPALNCRFFQYHYRRHRGSLTTSNAIASRQKQLRIQHLSLES